MYSLAGWLQHGKTQLPTLWSLHPATNQAIGCDLRPRRCQVPEQSKQESIVPLKDEQWPPDVPLLQGASMLLGSQTEASERLVVGQGVGRSVVMTTPGPLQLSLCSWDRQLQLLKPAHPRALALRQAKPPQLKSSLRSPLEKSPSNREDTAQPKINK